MPSNINFIIFAVKQAKEAEAFGFTRNEACRNLKIALHQYWQNKQLRQHGQAHRDKIPMSKAAKTAPKDQIQVEHAVPQQPIVNMLMDMEPLSEEGVGDVLTRLFRVRRVTKDEHARLEAKGLRSKMPERWNGRDPWARYDAAGIKCPRD